MSNGDLLDTFGNISKATGGTDLHPLLIAGMQGAANIASDGVKKDAAKEAAAQPTPKVTINGDGTFDIKNAPVTNLLEKGAADAQKPIDDVEALIRQRFAKAKAAGLVTEGDNPYGEDIAGMTSGVRGGFRASRELGASPIHAAIQGLKVGSGHFRTPDEIATQIRQARLAKVNAVYDTEAKPLLAEAQAQRTAARQDQRLNDSELNARQSDFEQYLPTITPESGDENAVVANATQRFKTLEPGWEGQIRSRVKTVARAYQKQQTDAGEAAIKGINENSVLPNEDPEAYVKSMPLANDEQRARALDRVKRTQQRVRQMDAKQQAALNIEVTRNRQMAQQLQFQQDMAKLNTPEAVKQSVDAVLNDGNQLYLIPDKSPGEKLFKAQVIAQVKAQTGGRLPQQIKPGSEDDKRIAVITQGKADIDSIEHLYDKWNTAGVPIGGPATAKINEAIIANKPSAYVARLAQQLVPGFSNLPKVQQDEYLTDASTAAHRINALTGRETRAVAGGRFSTQLFDVYKGTTPGFQSPEVFKGLIAGARQEFSNAESAIRQKQWSGEPPSAKSKGGDVKSLSNDDLFKRLMGH